jgi:hypothetical protein
VNIVGKEPAHEDASLSIRSAASHFSVLGRGLRRREKRRALSGAERRSLIEETRGLISRIAFGSCGNQNKPQPILKHVIERKPDLFCYLGDNIYGDSRSLAVLRAKT